MSHVSLSVIVPIYNAELYIERCVRSLMTQTLDHGIEFLFIDDCSTDTSLSILNDTLSEYTGRESQIRIFHHESNKGVAFSRAQGIRESVGDYLAWCDADDWCESSMFETMLIAAQSKNADIVTCNYFTHHANGKVESGSRTYHIVPSDHIRYLYQQPDTTLFLWNMIMRRDVLIQHHIIPFEGIDIGEDMNILVRVFCYAQRLFSVAGCLYHHTEFNPNSLTSRNGKSSLYRFQQDINNTEAICQFLERQDAKVFHLTCQYFRFLTKWGYDRLLGQTKEYYDLYRDTHRDIFRFTGIPLLLRIKLSFFFGSYPIYRICCFFLHLRS